MDAPTKLRVWMAERDIGSKQLSVMVGCDLNTVSRIRRGRRPPSLRIAQAIARITDGHISEGMWEVTSGD